MHVPSSLLAIAVTPCLALSPPQVPSSLTLTRNLTAIKNSAVPPLDAWPALPFRVEIEDDSHLSIFHLPHLDPPVNAEDIKSCLVDLTADIVSHYPQLDPLPARITFHSDEGQYDVQLTFLAADAPARTISYLFAQKITDALYDLMSEYGPRQITWADVYVKGVEVSHLWLTFAPSAYGK